jgi:uncharacterized protein (UPF0128 family)
LFVEHCNSVEEEQSCDVQIAKGEPHLLVCAFFKKKKKSSVEHKLVDLLEHLRNSDLDTGFPCF